MREAEHWTEAERIDTLYNLRDRYDTLACFRDFTLNSNERARVDVLYNHAKREYFDFLEEFNKK